MLYVWFSLIRSFFQVFTNCFRIYGYFSLAKPVGGFVFIQEGRRMSSKVQSSESSNQIYDIIPLLKYHCDYCIERAIKYIWRQNFKVLKCFLEKWTVNANSLFENSSYSCVSSWSETHKKFKGQVMNDHENKKHLTLGQCLDYMSKLTAIVSITGQFWWFPKKF